MHFPWKHTAIAVVAAITLILGIACADPPMPRVLHFLAPPPADCSKATLTADKFLDMFQAVAAHGDLTDISFVEKTFQVKFRSDHTDYNGKQDAHHTYYHSDSILGAPLSVILVISDEIALKDKSRFIAHLHFHHTPEEDFLFQCLRIPEGEFKSRFSGMLAYPPKANGSDIGFDIIPPRRIGNDQFKVDYLFFNGIISDVLAIDQLSPPPPPPLRLLHSIAER